MAKLCVILINVPLTTEVHMLTVMIFAANNTNTLQGTFPFATKTLTQVFCTLFNGYFNFFSMCLSCQRDIN